jgi:hypothetical protein
MPISGACEIIMTFEPGSLPVKGDWPVIGLFIMLPIFAD